VIEKRSYNQDFEMPSSLIIGGPSSSKEGVALKERISAPVGSPARSEESARENEPRTRLLVVTRHAPLPERDGAGAYLFDFLSYLSQRRFQIEIAWIHADGAIAHRGWWLVPERFARVARVHIPGGVSIGRWIFFPRAFFLPMKARVLQGIKDFIGVIGLGALMARRQKVSQRRDESVDGVLTTSHWSALPNDEETAFFKQRLQAFRPDTVLANYCWLSPLFDEVSQEIHRGILAHDVVSQRLQPTPGAKLDPATPEGETALLAKAEHVFAISEDDARVFRRFLPDHSIVLTPKAATPRALGAGNPSCVLFVGGINGFNHEGISWFLERVWPRIRQLQPDACLHVCGGICHMISSAPEGVVLKGPVLDLKAEYEAASVVIVPLLRGSGVKIKLVEAASFGRAIVTTPVGLQGLSFLRPHVMETSEAEDFAHATVQILKNPGTRIRLERGVLDAVGTHLSADQAYGSACRLLAGKVNISSLPVT
jgi:glycosyltransferase involved in cell wall biosynthesis